MPLSSSSKEASMGEKRTEERERRNISTVERKIEEEKNVWAHLWCWVFDCGTHNHQIFTKIPDILVFRIWKLLKFVFNSHHSNSTFLSFELRKLNSKTKPNNIIWVGLTIFEFWVMKIELYNLKLIKPNTL